MTILSGEDSERAERVAAEKAFSETLKLKIPKSIPLIGDFSCLGNRAAGHVTKALSRLHDAEADLGLLAGYAMRCLVYHSWNEGVHTPLVVGQIGFDEVDNTKARMWIGPSLVLFDPGYWSFEGHKRALLDKVYKFDEPPSEVALALALEVCFFDRAAQAMREHNIEDCLEFIGIAYELHGAVEIAEDEDQLVGMMEEDEAAYRREHEITTDVMHRNRVANVRRMEDAANRRREWHRKAREIWKQPQHKNKSASWVARQIAADQENANTIRRAIGHLKPSTT